MIGLLDAHRGPMRLALAVLLSTTSSVQAEQAPERGSITVDVGPLRNAKGSLACRLYRSGKGFPRTAEGTTTRRESLTSARARCSFEDLAPGTYAVVVHHDENDNRKFDRNFLGLPLEGYGASNNHTPAMRPPTWEDAKFSVERGKRRVIAISLRY